MNQYIEIEWSNDEAGDPVLIYLELDEDRWNTRKIELYSNGKVGIAADQISINGAQLAVDPFPDVEEYNRLNSEVLDDYNDELHAREISAQHFEVLWQAFEMKGPIA